MRGRQGKSANSQNLDSLLDTMANVVGILVVLMAVTQMTVNDAFERIRTSESVHAEEVNEERAEVERKLASLGPASLLDALETTLLRSHIERLRGDRDAVKVDQASAATLLAQLTLQARRLEKKVSTKRTELANLRIHLAEYEELEIPAAKELRLPDPRPAPLGAEPVVLLARYGRVLYPDLDRLQDDFFEVMRRSRGMSVAYFRDHDVGNRDLRWQVMNVGGGQVARLDWRRPTAGETLEELRKRSSALRNALARYDPKSHYVRFYVWGDSFEVYLEARRIAEAAGYSVGWEAYQIGQSLKFARSVSTAPTPVD